MGQIVCGESAVVEVESGVGRLSSCDGCGRSLASEAHRTSEPATSVRACFHPHTTLCSPSSPRGVLQEKQERRGEFEKKTSSEERDRGRRAREGRLQRGAPQLNEEASSGSEPQHWAGPLRKSLKPWGRQGSKIMIFE